MLAILCVSCNRDQSGKIDDGVPDVSQILVNDPFIVKPLIVDFGKSFINVSCEIKSEKEGDAYIVVQFGQQVPGKGFGEDVLIEGYDVFGYYQMSLDVDNTTFAPQTEFPAFIKKIKLPENKSFIEKFTIHFPDDLTIVGGISILRSNKDIVGYMNTKLYSDFYKVMFNNVAQRPVFDHYCKLFPESSIFSYLWLHHRWLLPVDRRENVIGYDNALFCWPFDSETSENVLIVDYLMPNFGGNQ